MPLGVFEAIGIGTSLLEGALGAGAARKAARDTVTSIDKEIAALSDRRGKLRSAFTARRGLVRDQFGNQVHSLLDSVGNSFEDITSQQQSSQAQSGFAFSGSIDSRAQKGRDRITTQFDSQRESLFDNLQSSIVDLDVSEADELGRIDSRISALGSERKVADDQTKKRFLGVF